MNKLMRSYGRMRKEDSDTNIHVYKPVGKSEYEEIKPRCLGQKRSRGRNKPGTGADRTLTGNRACMVAPEHHDVAQLTSALMPSDQYQKMLFEQYGFDPAITHSSRHRVKVMKNALSGHSVERASQCANPGPSVVANFEPKPDENPWKNIDTVDEIDQFIEQPVYDKHQVRISEIPKVTVIAEKFTRFQKDDIEVRKLDTRIVCIEYDIFDADPTSDVPIQKMRAFFSVKPNRKQNGISWNSVPSEIRNGLRVSDIDVQKLSEKEMEVIDGKIAENKPYLDDLRRVLKKKQAVSEKRNRNSLDLRSMYEMAKRECPPLDYDYSSTNLLSKAELDDVKGLILKHCESTANNDVSRRKVRRKNDTINDMGVKSESIFLDLLRENKTK